MRLRLIVCVVAALALVAALFGCGASTEQARPGNSYSGRSDTRPRISGGTGVSTARAAAKATANEVDYYGRKAFKLTNGLVTLIAVPAMGGRIMEYNLGGHAFLWVNKQQLRGSTDVNLAAEASSERSWVNYGGYKVWPAPQSRWGGPPDPEGSQLDGGKWSGKITAKSGAKCSVEMTSPADTQATGLQLKRRISLQTGSTGVVITETFKNVSKREVAWSIWGVTQVPGSVEPSEKVSDRARIFFPLNAGSKHSDGFFYLLDDPAGQYKKVANGKVLQTGYAGRPSKVGADAADGWIAYVDDMHDLTFVQTYEVTAGADYPDSGSTVQVYTSPEDLSYMEMETLSPIKTVPAGEQFSFESHWHCTKLGGPIVKVSGAGAVTKHPTAAKKGDKLTITGELGVFAPGVLTVEVQDKAGAKLAASKPLKVTPTRTVSLNATVDMPAGAHAAMVVLSTDKGKKLGNVAQVPLSAKLAKTTPTPNPES